MPAPSHTYIPLHRVAAALPFINYLRHSGIALERELQRARLPVLAMDDPDCFIPSRNFWTFIANVAEREGIKDLGFLVGLQSGANAADSGMTRQLLRSPSMCHALVRFCKFASKEISQVSLWFGPADKETHRLYYRPSFGCDHPAYVHFQWYGLMAAIGTIRLFTGKHWQPRHIGLGSKEKPGKTIRAYFPKTRFHLGQTDCFITLNNRLLCNPFHPRAKPGKSLPHFSKIKPAGNFIGTLKLALRSYLRDGAPSLELAADFAGLSTRTLQRRLTDEELSYRDLLDEVRYETAIDLMQETDNSITDIANLLGYSDPSHFARAFRRMAGVSPGEYQKK